MSGIPNIWLARAGDTLISTDERSLRVIRRLGEGELAAFKPLRPRSLKWHKRYWLLMSQLSQHVTEINISLGPEPVMMPITCAEDMHVAIKLVTGHCFTKVIEGTSYVLRIPKATDFSSMTADQWTEFYPRALDAVHERALPQIGVPVIQEELARLAS